MSHLTGKRVAILASNGFEESELLEPMRALRDHGAEVEVVSPESGNIQGFRHFDRGQSVPVDRDVAEASAADYDALVIPGGRGPEYLRTYPAVVAAVQHFFEANKPVAAICHAAQLLAGAGVLKGRSCSAYPACRAEVELAGGRYADIAVDKAHTDGNLVSAPAWPAHPDWIAQFLAVLGTRITH